MILDMQGGRAPGSGPLPDTSRDPGLPFAQPHRDLGGALLVTLLAGVLYGLTVQRTLSFWDCGEFIAASAILGIPHPPGAPLFILIGRLFTLLPAPEDIGLRVNLLSATSSAFAVGVSYLVVTRITRRFFFGPRALRGGEWVVALAGICGAMQVGFGDTVWVNAIEAEVYGLTLLLFMLLLYLTLVWIDYSERPFGLRLLVAGTFAAALGLGVHMMVFLALPALWLTVMLTGPQLRRDRRVWLAAAVTMSIMVTGIEAYFWNLCLCLGVAFFSLRAPFRWVQRVGAWVVPVWGILLFALFQAFLPLRSDVPASWLKSSTAVGRWFESFFWTQIDWGFFALVLLALLLVTRRSVRREDAPARTGWNLAAALLVAALAGFSVHGFLPIRSAQDPALDENDPETWEAFKGFVERKQYGRETMVARMFHRRGEWSNQLGRQPRMGFWSFFEKQFGIKSGPADAAEPASSYHPFAFPLLVVFGLFGVGYLAAVYWRAGLPLLVTLLLTTVGLVIYMNFADGTRFDALAVDQAYLEVRDRDYFFTIGFALFGICIGLGVAAFLRVFLEPERALWRPVLVVSSAVFLFALPFRTIQANWHTHDRSRDFVPFDYAWNMLQSCDTDAILFTTGDNDTFPLWCLQEAYRIRRDVRIINLSLANTFWYIHQVKERMGVPFHLAGEQIDALRPSREAGRIQDQVINTVIDSNQWRYPLFFGASSPEHMRVYHGMSLDSNLRLEGMVLRVNPGRGGLRVDRELTLRRYREEYRFRGVNDTTIFQTEATQRIADNYATGLLFVADAYRHDGLIDSALEAASMASRLRPRLAQTREYVVQLAGQFGLHDVLDSVIAAVPPSERPNLHVSFGYAAERAERPDRALPAYLEALRLDPDCGPAFQRAATLLYNLQSYDSLLALLDAWTRAHPGDTIGPLLRREVEFLMRPENAPQGAPTP